MNLKKEYFRMFLLLNIISITINLISGIVTIDVLLTNTSLITTIFLLLINISILILSKSKKISEKINLTISLMVVFTAYFLIYKDYYPFTLNNLTFGLNFLTILLIAFLNQKYDLMKITKRLTYIYLFLIVISFIISYQIAKNQNFTISDNVKNDLTFSRNAFILPIIWIIILISNKTIILKVIADNNR